MRYRQFPWRPPRAFGRGRPLGPARFIVIHYTAGSERSTSAEDGAAYDARRTDGVSTHFFIDENSTIQCVDTNDRANAAMYHGNRWGIQIEMCGTLQTRRQWLDEPSRATIRRTAELCVLLMRDHNIPPRRLRGTEVRSGRGICGHVDCTVGFPEDRGTHTDPGVEFPWDVLFGDIRDFMGQEEEEEMPGFGFENSEDPAHVAWDSKVRNPRIDARTARMEATLNAISGHLAGQGIEEIRDAMRTELAGALGAFLAELMPQFIDAIREEFGEGPATEQQMATVEARLLRIVEQAEEESAA